MNRKSALIAIPLVVTVCAAGWWWHNSHNRDQVPPVPAPEKLQQRVSYPAGAPQLAHIRVAAALALPEPLIEPLNARIAYDEDVTARISSPVQGRVIRIQAKLGDEVRRNQPLAWLDAPEFNAAVADESKSRAEVAQRKSALDRAHTLLDGGVIARKDFESAQADHAQAAAENLRATQRLTNLTRGLSDTAGVFALRSSIDGVVAERKLNPGMEVRSEAADPLFIVTDPTRLWVVIDVPEKYISKVSVGQKVDVDVDAYPGADFLGEVIAIAPALDPVTRRVQVRCTVPNPQRRLRPEMFARVTPIVDEKHKLVRVPNAALITEGLYTYLFVETQPGSFERRRVTLGLQGRDATYIRDGLLEGDRFVESGALLLNAELSTQN